MDQNLVVRAQQGDRRAFDTLTVTDYPRLFRVAHSVLRERARAEDATQQAYFDIWRNIRRLRDPAKFEGWSYRILDPRLLCRGQAHAAMAARQRDVDRARAEGHR